LGSTTIYHMQGNMGKIRQWTMVSAHNINWSKSRRKVTKLWQQKVQTDSTILNHKPDIW
jgi:hypothetical protein